MTLRFSKEFLFLLLFTLMAVGASAQAQESEKNNREQPENIIEVEVETFQSEALEIFLKEYRQTLKQSKLDISDVLKKSRNDSANIKQENSRTLKFTRQKKLPKVILKRIAPGKNKASQSVPKGTPPTNLEPPLIPEDFLFKRNFDEPRAPKQKDQLLSLEERQRLAEIETKRRKKNLQTQQSEMGRLGAEIQQAPLKGHQAKLVQFSGRIKELLQQLRSERGEGRAAFLDLGNTYLESQRYLNSLDSEDRLKLTSYAPHSGIALGSYELALWTFKMALTQDPNDGDTNFLLGKVFSEMGNRNEALERARNAEHLFTKNREQEKATQTRSFIDSLTRSSPQKYKIEF